MRFALRSLPNQQWTSSPANENYPNRLTQTSSQFQFPAAIWLKGFHNDF